MSHSTDRHWKRFLSIAAATAGVVLAVLFAAIAIVDPHDHLRLSPGWERAPVNTNQRYSYPALARAARFDSVVVGTSTSRLLDPAALERHFGGRFVNLAMNSATAYEQSRMAELFLRHHRHTRALIVGIDIVWCQPGEAITRYTFRPFPEWMYDEDPWNDYLHLLNGHTLEQTARQIEYFLGRREPKYGLNGYRSFLPPRSEYDLERAQRHIYGPEGPRHRSPPDEPVRSAPAWRFPTHPLLEGMLGAAPAAATKILFIVPYHAFNQPVDGTMGELLWTQCKRRLTRIASGVPNAHVLDFMIHSRITRRDENYWDRLHFSVEVADRIVALMAEGVRRRVDGEAYRYLRVDSPPLQAAAPGAGRN